jgi:hypothetical protein
MAGKEGAIKKKERGRQRRGRVVGVSRSRGTRWNYARYERVPQEEMTMRAPAKDIIIVEMAAPSPTRPP